MNYTVFLCKSTVIRKLSTHVVCNINCIRASCYCFGKLFKSLSKEYHL